MTATSTRRPAHRRDRHRRASASVLFLDDSRWATFHQLAPLLRRAGVRTIRVSVGPQAGSSTVSRLVYDRCEVLTGPTDIAGLRAILAREHVVDVQFVEVLGGLVRASLDLLEDDVAEQLRLRLTIQDKLGAAQLFADAGVRTPSVIPVAAATPGEVAASFGFPVVVKDRIGSAGTNVVIAHDLETLAAAAGPADSAGERYYEQFVAGDKLNYAAAAGLDGLEQELAYRVIRWLPPAGTALEIQTIRDPQLEEFGRRATEVAGCTGLVNMDVIRDRDGRDWLIDFNARAFGGAVAFRWAGIDISQGYLRSLGYRSEPVVAVTALADVRFPVFPTCLGDAVQTGKLTRTATAFLRDARPYARWVGLGYWCSEALATAGALHGARRRRGSIGPDPTTPAQELGVAAARDPGH